jgi:putative membrane protein
VKDDLFRFLKGFAMGTANVIPGVSGGTIAFITGIYERLIDALKRFDTTTVRLALKFRVREVWERIDGHFLAALGLGVAVGIALPARFLKWGFENHPVLVWAFFFGLIAASLPAVGKLVRRWSARPILALVVGVAIAVSMAFLTPASENAHPAYLLLCGMVAMCSMIIPGLSGSFVLLLMGNYQLIMIESFTAVLDGRIGPALRVLIPVGVGAVLGMLALARFLSWLFRTWHNLAVAAITGFIGGSLLIIWPWKETETSPFERRGEIKEKITGFSDWHLPDFSAGATWAALACMAVGVALIVLLERLGARPGRSKDAAAA